MPTGRPNISIIMETKMDIGKAWPTNATKPRNMPMETIESPRGSNAATTEPKMIRATGTPNRSLIPRSSSASLLLVGNTGFPSDHNTEAVGPVGPVVTSTRCSILLIASLSSLATLIGINVVLRSADTSDSSPVR